MSYKTKEKYKKYQREYQKRNREKINERSRRYYRNRSKEQIERRKELRKKFIDKIAKIKLESGCSICGYNKNSKALQFHHTDPTNKDLLISQAVVSRYSEKRIMNEITKCVVVCSNCHFEIHS